MTWFSDKLGKKFIFKPNGKPVKVIGFHGEPDSSMSYYTVQDAEGNLFRAFETELGDEVNRPVTPPELAIANVLLIEKLKKYFNQLIDEIGQLGSDYANGYTKCARDALGMIEALEARRDNV